MREKLKSLFLIGIATLAKNGVLTESEPLEALPTLIPEIVELQTIRPKNYHDPNAPSMRALISSTLYIDEETQICLTYRNFEENKNYDLNVYQKDKEYDYSYYQPWGRDGDFSEKPEPTFDEADKIFSTNGVQLFNRCKNSIKERHNES